MEGSPNLPDDALTPCSDRRMPSSDVQGRSATQKVSPRQSRRGAARRCRWSAATTSYVGPAASNVLGSVVITTSARPQMQARCQPLAGPRNCSHFGHIGQCGTPTHQLKPKTDLTMILLVIAPDNPTPDGNKACTSPRASVSSSLSSSAGSCLPCAASRSWSIAVVPLPAPRLANAAPELCARRLALPGWPVPASVCRLPAGASRSSCAFRLGRGRIVVIGTRT